MKKTLTFSITLAVLLNVWQFVSSLSQRQAAFAPAWATATTTPRPGAAARAKPLTEPQPATVATASNTNLASTAPGGDPLAAAIAKLSAAALKPDYAALYLDTEARTGTPWELLAAVHKTESGQRGDTTVTSYAGAQGPMQFMPATFRAYALDGDGDGDKQATDLEDAMLTAGRYLAAGGADKGNYSGALYHYNHSHTYVSQVLALARRLGI